MLAATLALTLTLALPADELPRRGALGLALAPLPAALRTQHQLPGNQGLLAQSALPGLTGDRAGIKAGDILVSLDGKAIVPGMLNDAVRNTPVGQTLTFRVLREGKPLDLKTALVEKPRDPGNANYSVTYSHVVANGQRMRTIITVPTKAGRHPGFFFIQGFSPISYDFTLEGAKGDVSTLDGPILFDFANSGFVTMRVEKPGVGDSEGGPFAQLDYRSEIDIYRQALKQLKAHASVDPENVFIFGHSMGGAFGPMIAAEIPVKGIAVYGTAARTWYEYLLDTLRYQGLLGGATHAQIDEQIRQGSRLMALVFQEGKTVGEVKKSHPQLSAMADALMPGGLFNGKTTRFWAQLGEINFPDYWVRANTRVLSARGVSDFVTYDADHTLIADAINTVRPGTAKFVSVPASDHLFHRFETEKAALAGYTQGTYNPEFSRIMMAWIRDVIAGK